VSFSPRFKYRESVTVDDRRGGEGTGELSADDIKVLGIVLSLSLSLSLCLSVCLCACVSICLSVCLSVDTPDETDRSLVEDELQKSLAFLLDRVEGCSVSLFTSCPFGAFCLLPVSSVVLAAKVSK